MPDSRLHGSSFTIFLVLFWRSSRLDAPRTRAVYFLPMPIGCNLNLAVTTTHHHFRSLGIVLNRHIPRATMHDARPRSPKRYPQHQLFSSFFLQSRRSSEFYAIRITTNPSSSSDAPVHSGGVPVHGGPTYPCRQSGHDGLWRFADDEMVEKQCVKDGYNDFSMTQHLLRFSPHLPPTPPTPPAPCRSVWSVLRRSIVCSNWRASGL